MTIRKPECQRLKNSPKNSPFIPHPLCALSALCGETSSELTTEGTESTEQKPKPVSAAKADFKKISCGRAEQSVSKPQIVSTVCVHPVGLALHIVVRPNENRVLKQTVQPGQKGSSKKRASAPE